MHVIFCEHCKKVIDLDSYKILCNYILCEECFANFIGIKQSTIDDAIRYSGNPECTYYMAQVKLSFAFNMIWKELYKSLFWWVK